MHSSPWRTLPFYLAFLLPPLAVICIFERGWWVFAPLALVFIVTPLGDALLGVAAQGREAPDLAFNRYFRVVTWLWVPAQTLLIYWILREVARGSFSRMELAGTTLVAGTTAGFIGGAVGHELIHRRYQSERVLGYFLFFTIGYLHAALGHIGGHHRWVGTPNDPSTARYRESLYGFLPRTVFGTLRLAWTLERQRLLRMNATTFSWANRIVRSAFLTLLLYAALWIWGGPQVLLVYAGHAVVAIGLVETINYIQHYGLQRHRGDGNDFEKVAGNHTWESGHRLSNWLLLNLPRHADHHTVPNKRYQALELLPQAPRLPAGYATMLLAALVPPIWFAMMNHRTSALSRVGRTAAR
ncbi:MAG: alkane 1-monooxygenase [Vicinamibacterales bacterium]